MLNDNFEMTNGKFRGFTLIEIAIILVILGLLIGITLPLLSGLSKHRHYRSTQKDLEEIKEALIGYAGINWRLPSADTDGDGQGNGIDAAGTLPYLDLGLGAQDAWRNQFIYDVNFSLTTTTNKSSFCTALSSLSGNPQLQQGASTTPQAAIVVSKGENSALDGENGDGDRTYVSQTPTDTFDDLLISLNPNTLYGRLNCGSQTGSTSCTSFTVWNRSSNAIWIKGGDYVLCPLISINNSFTIKSRQIIFIYSSRGLCFRNRNPIATLTFNTAASADSNRNCNVKLTNSGNLADE